MFSVCIKGCNSYLFCLTTPHCVKETSECRFVSLTMSHCFTHHHPPPHPIRMDTTEQCNAVISHFNGKFIKIASGALGRKKKLPKFPSNKNGSAGND